MHDTVHIVEESADGVGWVDARVESLPGADGPIETVVYGPDWRSSSVVVVALHGGPDAHWTLAFDSLFQLLAGAGLTVVAPNQRGSTGYGRAYQDAIAGAWAARTWPTSRLSHEDPRDPSGTRTPSLTCPLRQQLRGVSSPARCGGRSAGMVRVRRDRAIPFGDGTVRGGSATGS